MTGKPETLGPITDSGSAFAAPRFRRIRIPLVPARFWGGIPDAKFLRNCRKLKTRSSTAFPAHSGVPRTGRKCNFRNVAGNTANSRSYFAFLGDAKARISQHPETCANCRVWRPFPGARMEGEMSSGPESGMDSGPGSARAQI